MYSNQASQGQVPGSQAQGQPLPHGHHPRPSQQWDPRDQPPLQQGPYPHQPQSPAHNHQYPPPPPGSQPRQDMAAMHHQQQHYPPPSDYRMPNPPNGPYYAPSDPYNRQPPMPNGMNDPYRQSMQNGGGDMYRQPVQQQAPQPAPRQRTAIACKYCRRRKIRCSGFDNSEDGRCSNCVRFSQECVFTPVSAQTQAFVPAQALWRSNGRGPVPGQPLYGAFGQPIYPQQGPPQGYGQLPSPTAPYPPSQQQMYQQPYPTPPPQPHDQAGARRRGRDEPHAATLPPPNPAQASHLAVHRDSDGQAYTYPDPTPHHQGAVSPATSTQSYNQHAPQPYYAAEPPRRSSPQSAYSYDNSRASASPQTQYQHTGAIPPQAHQVTPNRSDERTSPPSGGQSNQGRPGMSIHDIVSENGSNGHSPGERTTTDNDMVSALNRRGGAQNGRGGSQNGGSEGRRS